MEFKKLLAVLWLFATAATILMFDHLGNLAQNLVPGTLILGSAIFAFTRKYSRPRVPRVGSALIGIGALILIGMSVGYEWVLADEFGNTAALIAIAAAIIGPTTALAAPTRRSISDLERAKRTAQDKETEASKLLKEKNTLETERNEAKGSLNQETIRKNALEKEKERLSNDLQEEKDAHTATRESLTQKESALAEAEKKAADAEKKLQRETAVATDKRVKTVEEERNEALTKVASLETELDETQNKVAEETARADTAEKEWEIVQQRFEESKENLTATQQRLESVESDMIQKVANERMSFGEAYDSLVELRKMLDELANSEENEFSGIIGSTGRKLLKDIEGCFHEAISLSRRSRGALNKTLKENNEGFVNLGASIAAEEARTEEERNRADAAEADLAEANARIEEETQRRNATEANLAKANARTEEETQRANATEANLAKANARTEEEKGRADATEIALKDASDIAKSQKERADAAEADLTEANARAEEEEKRADAAETALEEAKLLLDRVVTLEDETPSSQIVRVRNGQKVDLCIGVAVLHNNVWVKTINRVISAGETKNPEPINKPEGISLKVLPVSEFTLLDTARKRLNFHGDIPEYIVG